MKLLKSSNFFKIKSLSSVIPISTKADEIRLNLFIKCFSISLKQLSITIILFPNIFLYSKNFLNLFKAPLTLSTSRYFIKSSLQVIPNFSISSWTKRKNVFIPLLLHFSIKLYIDLTSSLVIIRLYSDSYPNSFDLIVCFTFCTSNSKKPFISLGNEHKADWISCNKSSLCSGLASTASFNFFLILLIMSSFRMRNELPYWIFRFATLCRLSIIVLGGFKQYWSKGMFL